jgi:hypothetical protein
LAYRKCLLIPYLAIVVEEGREGETGQEREEKDEEAERAVEEGNNEDGRQLVLVERGAYSQHASGSFVVFLIP